MPLIDRLLIAGILLAAVLVLWCVEKRRLDRSVARARLAAHIDADLRRRAELALLDDIWSRPDPYLERDR